MLTFTPLALRVCEEVLDGVYHFAPEDDRDWVRVRTRLGLAYDTDDLRAEVILDRAREGRDDR